jgi:hypothetical protein
MKIELIIFSNMLYNIGEGDDTDGRNKVEEYQTVR